MGTRRGSGNASHGFVSIYLRQCWRPIGVLDRLMCSGHNARFTLANPMPRLGSDVVGGNSGRNHPTSRRHTIHIGRMARNVSIRVGCYEGVVQYCTTPWLVRWKSLIYYNSLSCVVHVRLPIGRRRRAILNMFNIARWPPDGLPMRPRRPIQCRETIHIGRADSIGAQSGHRIR